MDSLSQNWLIPTLSPRLKVEWGLGECMPTDSKYLGNAMFLSLEENG